MKYRAKRNLLETLKSFPVFEKEMIEQLGSNKRDFNLQASTIDTYISRFLDRKEIIAFKRGWYVTSDFYNTNKSNEAYLFFLANVIRKLSYVSSWTALQYYNLSTEVIHAVTSVSLKVTRTYNTKIGTFAYQSIKKELFTDFTLVDGTFRFFIATPAKALFDMLYFKTRQFRGMKFENIDPLLEELRVDINEMDAVNRDRFYSMVKNLL